MTRGSIWKLSVSTTAEAEDAVSDSLAKFFGRPPATHTDFRTGRTTVSLFFETEPSALPAFRREWKQTLAGLISFGLDCGSGTVRIQLVRRENWAESWKRHFKPLEIGDTLLVKPSWIKRKPKRGQAVVVLDPGLSFGTGQHATTSFCLRELVHRRKAGARQFFLDIGTGSGILAIAAAKLGYAPVHAFDFDPESVRVARANAKANRVERKLSLARRDLTKLPETSVRRYDVICANLISTLLIAERRRIACRVKPGGALVVAGILATEFSRVRIAFEPLGFRLMARKREKEWTSGAFLAA
jgi:ribosomal protein L11 methyltransferase